jgi:2C-methyl-D-erythritol 2,4-cyclodiphosphate synthase
MDLARKSDAEILQVARPIMDSLMDASTAIDYEKHVRDFTDRAKSVLPKERLQAICAEYQRTKGFFGKRELVAIFRRPESVVVIWKQLFTKQPGEFVAELLLVQSGSRYLVDHVMVF